MFFRDKYVFLSNLNDDYHFIYKNVPFDCVERAYRWEQSCDDVEKNKILSLSNSLACKKIKVKNNVIDWHFKKVAIMRDILQSKYSTNSEFKAKINLVKEEIVETNSWHDNFWGDCVCNKIKYPKYGVKKQCLSSGKNNIGLILESIKNKI